MDKKTFKGPVETVKELIIAKDELQAKSVEEIYDIICTKLYYSASEDNKIKKYKYKVTDITNLENVIYQCPACFHEGLTTAKNQLICPKCLNTLIYDEYGLLNGRGLDEWFLEQESRVRKAIDENPSYEVSGKTRLMSFRNEKLVFVGEGILTIRNFEYIYIGTIDGKEQTLRFNTRIVPSLPSDIGRNVQIYESDQIYQFEMDNKWLPTKMVHVGEYLYLLKKE